MTGIEGILATRNFDGAVNDLAIKLCRVLVGVRSRAGSGSGTTWDDQGLVVTNAHVVLDGDVEVVTGDGDVLTGQVLARDSSVDLASIRVQDSRGKLEPAVPGDSSALRPGELLFAAGNPWGERGTITAGVVIGRRQLPEAPLNLPDAVLADLRLGPGNSGGPLADAAGRVVGINSMIAGGLAVAIPVETVAAFLAESREPGFLGITLLPVELAPAIAAGEGAASGLLITGVAEGGAADSAGLLPGDVLVQVDGAPAGVTGVARRLERMRAGESLELTLVRGGKPARLVAIPLARAS